MVTFELVMQANADEVRQVATIEMSDRQWDVVLCFEEPEGSLELVDLEEIPTAAAVRRLSGVLWRLLDHAADSFPASPRRLLSDGRAPAQEATLDAGERVASLVMYLSEYSEATLSISRESPIRR